MSERHPNLWTDRRRALVGRLGVILAGVGLAGVALSQAASADLEGASSYTVVARADALAFEYVNTAAPVFGDNPIVYGTPSTAQSLVDSVGQSTAFASAPYPGDIMVGLPDNGNGLIAGSGAPIAFPSYPFYVHSEYPIRPNAEEEQSGNRLVAHSEQHASSSAARSGMTGDLLAATQAQASSSAAVDPVTGTLTATADSRLDAFRVTEALQVGKSSSHAKVVKEPGRPVVKETSFTVASIIVNGVEVGLTGKGFELGSGNQAPPTADLNPLFEGLKGAGITVELLPATETESSVESAGLQITQVQKFGDRTQRVSFILGRVSTRIEGSAAPTQDSLLSTVPDDQTGPSSTPRIDTPLGPSDGLADMPPPGTANPVPELVSFGASAPSAAAAGSETAAIGGAAPTQKGRFNSQPDRQQSAIRARASRHLPDDDMSGFYLALVAAGTLAFLGTRLLGVLGFGARTAAASEGDASSSVLRLPPS